MTGPDAPNFQGAAANDQSSLAMPNFGSAAPQRIAPMPMDAVPRTEGFEADGSKMDFTPTWDTAGAADRPGNAMPNLDQPGPMAMPMAGNMPMGGGGPNGRLDPRAVLYDRLIGSGMNAREALGQVDLWEATHGPEPGSFVPVPGTRYGYMPTNRKGAVTPLPRDMPHTTNLLPTNVEGVFRDPDTGKVVNQPRGQGKGAALNSIDLLPTNVEGVFRDPDTGKLVSRPVPKGAKEDAPAPQWVFQASDKEFWKRIADVESLTKQAKYTALRKAKEGQTGNSWGPGAPNATGAGGAKPSTPSTPAQFSIEDLNEWRKGRQ
jgi:hypothetical protein